MVKLPYLYLHSVLSIVSVLALVICVSGESIARESTEPVDMGYVVDASNQRELEADAVRVATALRNVLTKEDADDAARRAVRIMDTIVRIGAVHLKNEEPFLAVRKSLLELPANDIVRAAPPMLLERINGNARAAIWLLTAALLERGSVSIAQQDMLNDLQLARQARATLQVESILLDRLPSPGVMAFARSTTSSDTSIFARIVLYDRFVHARDVVEVTSALVDYMSQFLKANGDDQLQRGFGVSSGTDVLNRATPQNVNMLSRKAVWDAFAKEAVIERKTLLAVCSIYRFNKQQNKGHAFDSEDVLNARMAVKWLRGQSPPVTAGYEGIVDLATRLIDDQKSP